VRLIPNDERDFAYTVAAFRCQAGGSLRVRLADDTIRTLAVVAGQWVDLPVRRIYRTGTTAWGFVSGDGDYCIPYASTGTLPPPLLTFPAPYSLYRLDGDGLDAGTGNNPMTTDFGTFGTGTFGQALATGFATAGGSPLTGTLKTRTDTVWVGFRLKVTSAILTENIAIGGAGVTLGGFSFAVGGASGSNVVFVAGGFLSGLSSPVAAVDGQWLAVVFCVSASELRIYVDGTLVLTEAVTLLTTDLDWSDGVYRIYATGDHTCPVDDVFVVTGQTGPPTARQLAYLAQHRYPGDTPVIWPT